MTNSIGDLAEADTIFVIGSNTTEAHPVISLEIIRAKREGKKLIVADPRRIDLARRADIHLQIRPGTNVALLNGMMRHILDSGLEDRDFIAERTEGYDEFVESVRALTVEQGACDMGALPNVFSGYQKVDDPASIKKMEEAWGVTLDDRSPGQTVVEMMNGAGEGTIRAMYIMGENPVLSDPDQAHVESSLKKVEFLVVQDVFRTETAEYADVVLPAAMPTEKQGTFTNTERRVQRVREALAPLEGSLADWDILQRLANRMGASWDYSGPGDIMREINAVTPSYGGITHERVEESGLQWPCPTVDHPGTSILHVGEFARGKGKLSAIEYIEPAESVDQEYQFVLTTGRELVHYHTGTLSRRAPGVDALVPEGRLEINPDDAARLGIEEGSRVRVTSRRGSIEPLAWVTDRVAPGLVFMPFHYWEAPANRLTNPVLDPVAKIPEYKVSAVKLQAV